MGEEAIVRTMGLGKSFGSTVALRDVDLTIGRGEVFGYLGPNGAGKTTTLRLLLGMLRPTTGRASVLGLDAWRDAVAVHRRVGYLPGEPALYGKLSGRQHVAYFGHLRGAANDRRALSLADRLDLDLDRPAHELSKGNRQKLAVVLALMSGPELLVLDEPTSGLDPVSRDELTVIFRKLAEKGVAILFSTHITSDLEKCADAIAYIKDGELLASMKKSDFIQKYASEMGSAPSLEDIMVFIEKEKAEI